MRVQLFGHPVTLPIRRLLDCRLAGIDVLNPSWEVVLMGKGAR
jgi:hypothetical protein